MAAGGRTRERELAGWQDEADRPCDTAADSHYRRERQAKSWFGEDRYYLPGAPSPGLMGIWTEVGLEPFSYYRPVAAAAMSRSLPARDRERRSWTLADHVQGKNGAGTFQNMLINVHITIAVNSPKISPRNSGRNLV